MKRFQLLFVLLVGLASGFGLGRWFHPNQPVVSQPVTEEEPIELTALPVKDLVYKVLAPSIVARIENLEIESILSGRLQITAQSEIITIDLWQLDKPQLVRSKMVLMNHPDQQHIIILFHTEEGWGLTTTLVDGRNYFSVLGLNAEELQSRLLNLQRANVS